VKVAIRGPVEDVTGYATVTREIALALHRLGVEVALRPVPWGVTKAELPAENQHLLTRLTARREQGHCLLNIGIPPLFDRGHGRPAIGLTMLEVDGIPPAWAHSCNQMDEIWVPSRFNAATFRQSGVDTGKIRVMPLGVDTNLFTPAGPKLVLPESGPFDFTFLSVFEWVPRKGYDILLAAYLQEFTRADNVCLVLKSHSNSPDYDPDGVAIKRVIQDMIKQYCGESPRTPAIILLPQVLPASQMPALYRAADCFVLPTRGEGWNLPALEALACGVPVITTAWSAHLDWLNQENAFLINVEALEAVPSYRVPNDAVYRGCRWARPSIAHLRQLMRWVYEHRAAARERALKASPAIRLNLSWDASAQRIYSRLQEFTSPQSYPVSIAATTGPDGLRGAKEAGATARQKVKIVVQEESCPQVAMVIPSWGSRCGLAEYTKALCLALQGLDCQVKILGGPLAKLRPAEWQGIPIVHWQYEYSLYNNEEVEALYRLIKARGSYPLLTLHSFTEDARTHNLLLQRLFPKIIVHAEHTRELLRHQNWQKDVQVIPMGVPAISLEGREEIKKELGCGTGPAIGFCGFMHWYKGILSLALAVKKIRTIYPGARCYLFSSVSENVSSGEFLRHFWQQVEVLGLKEVVVLKPGFLPEAKLVRYLNAMDINVLPYTECGYNSTSAAVRLLMAARRPVITTDIPFFADLTDQVVKIAEATPEAIFDALTWLLGEPLLQKELIARLDQYARENTWEASARKHRQLYLELQQERRRNGVR